MGRDKLDLDVGGAPLLHRVYDALSSHCDEVILVGGAARLEGARRVPDERRGGLGPLAGIEAGLAAAANGQVFVAAGDLPFLTPDLVGFLLQRLVEREAWAVVPRYAGETHPLCAAYDRGLLPHVRLALDGGVRSVREFLGGVERVDYVGEELPRFGNPDLFLMNVNSPEDLVRARRGADR